MGDSAQLHTELCAHGPQCQPVQGLDPLSTPEKGPMGGTTDSEQLPLPEGRRVFQPSLSRVTRALATGLGAVLWGPFLPVTWAPLGAVGMCSVYKDISNRGSPGWRQN